MEGHLRKERGMAQENQEASTGQEALGAPAETEGQGFPLGTKVSLKTLQVSTANPQSSSHCQTGVTKALPA